MRTVLQHDGPDHLFERSNQLGDALARAAAVPARGAGLAAAAAELAAYARSQPLAMTELQVGRGLQPQSLWGIPTAAVS